MSATDLAVKLKSAFPELVSEPSEFRGEVSVEILAAERIHEVCRFTKAELGFDYLVDITSIDNYGEDPRFSIVYHLYGLEHRRYLRLRIHVSEESAEVPTVITVWRTADWHEREIYDMMGIRFRGHPDLRRILMWEGYPHYPLLKDFPLAGKTSNVPEVAFTERAPWVGGPFVTVAGGKDAMSREPRVRVPDSDSIEMNARVESRTDNKRTHGEAHGPGPIEGKP